MDNVTTLFGISCNRQINASELKKKSTEVTRSAVHKSVVVIARKPIFGAIREKLAVITRAFFQQGDFSDLSLIDNLYDNLHQLFSTKVEEHVMHVSMSLRELIFRLRNNVLILLKALLLEKKIIFHSTNTEVLCASQFSLVSLIPALMDHLEDCSSPLLHKFEGQIKKPMSLRSSDRNSLLSYMGLPLQPFAEGGAFNPYVPLQQMDELKAPETKYFLAGTTNSIIVEGIKADVVVHMDNDTVDIKTSGLKNILALSPSDKKWIDFVVKSVVETWDPEDPWRPKGLGFHGSEDFVRQQFEDYIMGLLSSVKYDSFLGRLGNSPPKAMMLREVDGNPLKLFNQAWVKEWRKTNNFRIFAGVTDDEIFDIVEPRHMAVSLNATMENHQRNHSTMSQLSLRTASPGGPDSGPASRPRSRVTKVLGSLWWGSQDQHQLQSQAGPIVSQHSQAIASHRKATSDVFHDQYLGPEDPAATLVRKPSGARGRTFTVSSNHTMSYLSTVQDHPEDGGIAKPAKAATSPVAGAATAASMAPPPKTGGIFTGWSLWGSGKSKPANHASSSSLHTSNTAAAPASLGSPASFSDGKMGSSPLSPVSLRNRQDSINLSID